MAYIKKKLVLQNLLYKPKSKLAYICWYFTNIKAIIIYIN